ncbi:hypothetical protein [Paramagnetospirillum kuznetsovii]|nr:hypothetical protein [Paramagnetospirillum kuznetsovii]
MMDAQTCAAPKCLIKRVVGVAALAFSLFVIVGTVVGWSIIGLTSLMAD